MVGVERRRQGGERRRVALLAAERDAPFAGLWLEAPGAVMTRRVETRGADASDADRAVLHGQLAADIGRLDWTRIAARAGIRDTLKRALAALPSAFDTGEGARP